MTGARPEGFAAQGRHAELPPVRGPVMTTDPLAKARWAYRFFDRAIHLHASAKFGNMRRYAYVIAYRHTILELAADKGVSEDVAAKAFEEIGIRDPRPSPEYLKEWKGRVEFMASRRSVK